MLAVSLRPVSSSAETPAPLSRTQHHLSEVLPAEQESLEPKHATEKGRIARMPEASAELQQPALQRGSWREAEQRARKSITTISERGRSERVKTIAALTDLEDLASSMGVSLSSTELEGLERLREPTLQMLTVLGTEYVDALEAAHKHAWDSGNYVVVRPDEGEQVPDVPQRGKSQTVTSTQVGEYGFTLVVDTADYPDLELRMQEVRDIKAHALQVEMDYLQQLKGGK